MRARLAGGQEGINILMHKDVGQNIATKYPVYSMLASLNPSEQAISGKYHAPDGDTKMADIETSLKKLPTTPDNQPAQLNTLLSDTWKRYQQTDTYKSDPEA